MTPIGTRVTDTLCGLASGLRVALYLSRDGSSERCELAPAVVKFAGRADDHFSADLAEAYVYRLEFDTGVYFTRTQADTVYRKVQLFFALRRTKCIIIYPMLVVPLADSINRGS